MRLRALIGSFSPLRRNRGKAAPGRPPFFARSKNLAILGASQVGKTTLIRLLRNRGNAAGLRPRRSFWLVTSGQPVLFRIPKDLSGDDGPAYHHWRREVKASTDVWYLFRADRVAAREPDELSRVEQDLRNLRRWIDVRRGQQRRSVLHILLRHKKPKVVLIGTWADTHDGFVQGPNVFVRHLRATPCLRDVLNNLNDASLISGGLNTRESGRELLKHLGAVYSNNG